MTSAEAIAGSLSAPSKMPGYGYGLPALKSCKTGSKLAKIPGTACSTCYALRGRYQFQKTIAAQQRRLDAIDDPRWEDAMVDMIGRRREKYFRWHDSGDIVSLDHLSKICRIAVRLPEYKFWLPTQERELLKQHRKQFGEFPPNLTVRISGIFVDHKPRAQGFLTSNVYKDTPPYGHACPAQTQGNECGTCRACWDPTVPNISYPAH